MTAKSDEPREMITLEYIEEQAADWFCRRNFWSWSQSDEDGLNGWLAQSPAHEIAYWRLETGWLRGERMAALRQPAEKPASAAGRNLLSHAARLIAGAIVLGLIGLGVRFYLTLPYEQTYATALGGYRSIALGDGSKVELNTDSVLRVRTGADGRTASLERGEAFFEIRHDAAHPFVVEAAGHRVTDLGTKFLLRLDRDGLTMALTEGRARLEAETPGLPRRPVLLAPGDTAIAAGASLLLRKTTVKSLDEALGWRRGLLVFDRTTIADAAREFNRYNEEKLIVADAVAGRTITGTFRKNNIGDFTSLARDVLGLHVQRWDAEILISR